jgi:hypothetical protein
MLHRPHHTRQELQARIGQGNTYAHGPTSGLHAGISIAHHPAQDTSGQSGQLYLYRSPQPEPGKIAFIHVGQQPERIQPADLQQLLTGHGAPAGQYGASGYDTAHRGGDDHRGPHRAATFQLRDKRFRYSPEAQPLSGRLYQPIGHASGRLRGPRLLFKSQQQFPLCTEQFGTIDLQHRLSLPDRIAFGAYEDALHVGLKAKAELKTRLIGYDQLGRGPQAILQRPLLHGYDPHPQSLQGSRIDAHRSLLLLLRLPDGHQLHMADRTQARLIADHLRMHAASPERLLLRASRCTRGRRVIPFQIPGTQPVPHPQSGKQDYGQHPYPVHGSSPLSTSSSH